MVRFSVCNIVLNDETSKRVANQHWWKREFFADEISNITCMCLLQNLELTGIRTFYQVRKLTNTEQMLANLIVKEVLY